VFSFTQVLDAVLIAPPSYILDDIGLAISETIFKNVINWLDF